MKRVFLLLLLPLLIPLAAQAQLQAQPQAQPTPEQQAMGATIMTLTQETVLLRVQIYTLQAEVERLKAGASKDTPKDNAPK